MELYVFAKRTIAHKRKTIKKYEYPIGFGGNPRKKSFPGFEYSGKRFGKRRET